MARLYLIGPVDYEMYSKFSKQLRELETDKSTKGTVIVEICSEGGDGDIGLALYGRIRASNLKFKAVGHGVVHSAALGAFIACDERVCTPECTFLIHNSRDKTSGDYRDQQKGYKKLVADEEKWAELFEKHTGTDRQTWRDLSDEDTFLPAVSAKLHGLVTKIVGE